jgi:hypothetical protein
LAVHNKSLSFKGIRTDPSLQKMLDDPRFGELLAAAGLPR